jgi:transcriptional regulator with XRE-family HTH domain
MLRELKGRTQVDLAERSGIATTNISLLENQKVEIGKRRAEQLARATPENYENHYYEM